MINGIGRVKVQILVKLAFIKFLRTSYEICIFVAQDVPLSPRYATSKTEAAALPRGSGEVGPAARPGPNVIPRIWGGRNGTPAPGFLRLRVAEIRRVMKSDADPPFQDAASLLVIPAGTLLASRNLHCVHCEARPYNPACGN